MSHNLPKHLSPFVGRTTEIAEISELLNQADCRLLSLIGPSGMGKTRLSLEIANQQHNHFTDGVYFVSLQPLISADTVVSAIASSIKFDSYDEDKDLQEQLLDYLSNKNVLLLMDNFEHVLEGAELVAHILSVAPHIKFLVTSREALKLQLEWIHPVAGMPYPDTLDVSEIGDYSAVQLFIERAQQFRRNLTIEDELPHIIRICQLVGGMPLGIELAVAWLRTLSCAEIATEIEQNNDLLTAQMRDIAERHQSIRTIFDSTWQMLTADEQTIFMRLSIFRGTPTRQAIQTVTGAGLLALSGLVDKALLISTDNGRYQIHALLRQYALEKLEASDEHDKIRCAHSEYYLCFLYDRQPDIYGRRQIEAVDEITQDFENIRSAWYTALDMMNHESIGLAIETLSTYLHFRSRWKQESHMLTDAQTRFAPTKGEDPHPVWGMILARNFSNSPQPFENLKRALAIAEATNNRAEIGLVLHLMGHQCGKMESEHREAIQYFERSIPYFEEVGNNYHLAASYGFAAMNYRFLGDYETSLAYNEKNLTMSRSMGNIDGQTIATVELAETMLVMGNLLEAEQYRNEALLLAKQIGRAWHISWLKLELGIYHAFGINGDIETTTQLMQEVENFSDYQHWRLTIELSKSLIMATQERYDQTRNFDEHSLMFTKAGWYHIFLWNKLMIACGQGDYDTAYDFTYQLIDYYRERRAIPFLLLGISFSAIWKAYRDHNWRRATELIALASTHPSSMSGWLNTWAVIDRLHDDLDRELGTDIFQAMWEHGTSLDWEQVVAELITEFESDNSQLENNGTIDPQILSANSGLPEPLSERELEVLLKITEGYSNKEIADQLFVGVSTVKKHITHIYGKLQVESRTQAVLRAQELTLA